MSGMDKRPLSSTLAFDIAQFFPLLNNQLLPMILNKADFDTRISQFFSSYLINRQTQYVWNHFTSPFSKVGVGIEQGPAKSLFPTLLALYIASLFHIFKKRTKNLSIPIPVSILSFVNNGLFVSQKKSYEKSNVVFYYSYSIISSLFNQFGSAIKHNKSEVFHFSRSNNIIDPSPLDLKDLEVVPYSDLKIHGNI